MTYSVTVRGTADSLEPDEDGEVHISVQRTDPDGEKIVWVRAEDVSVVAAPVPTGQELVGKRVHSRNWHDGDYREVLAVVSTDDRDWFIIADDSGYPMPCRIIDIDRVEGFGDTPPAQPDPMHGGYSPKAEARPAAEPVGWVNHYAATEKSHPFGAVHRTRSDAEDAGDTDPRLPTLCAVVPVDGPEPEPPEPYGWLVRTQSGHLIGWHMPSLGGDEAAARKHATQVGGTVHRVSAPVPDKET